MLLPRHASQFDPTIDKERKFISNLGQNMPVLPDSPKYAALRADMKGDRLNSRFQHINKNKSVKLMGLCKKISVIVQNEYHSLDKFWSMAIRY